MWTVEHLRISLLPNYNQIRPKLEHVLHHPFQNALLPIMELAFKNGIDR